MAKGGVVALILPDPCFSSECILKYVHRFGGVSLLVYKATKITAFVSNKKDGVSTKAAVLRHTEKKNHVISVKK